MRAKTPEEYWRLERAPFDAEPNPSFFFPSEQHQTALERMSGSLREGKKLVLLTGEYGCGKSLIVSKLRQELAGLGRLGLVASVPSVQPKNLMEKILYQLGLRFGYDSRDEAARTLRAFLLRNQKSRRGKPVIFLDDSQRLDDQEAQEDLRELLRSETDDGSLLSIVLVGRERLGSLLKRAPHLWHQISTRAYLTPLPEEDTKRYIEHRLKQCRCDRELFSPDAAREVHALSGGRPSEINSICGTALLIAAEAEAEDVDVESVRAAHEDVKCAYVEPEEAAPPPAAPPEPARDRSSSSETVAALLAALPRILAEARGPRSSQFADAIAEEVRRQLRTALSVPAAQTPAPAPSPGSPGTTGAYAQAEVGLVVKEIRKLIRNVGDAARTAVTVSGPGEETQESAAVAEPEEKIPIEDLDAILEHLARKNAALTESGEPHDP